MYRCFVICPFGHEDREGEGQRLFHELAGLKAHIFARAEAICRERNVPVEIVDARLTDEGQHISLATQQAIDFSEAVIVVLTADNPNVFVELGWAHGMWHDPILLKRDGYDLPVDINNLICIPFTTAQTEGKEPQRAEQTAQLLAGKLLDRIKARRQLKPFTHWPNSTLARGSVRAYNRFSSGISIADWSDTLQAADREIIVASSGMSRIFGQQMFWRDAPDAEQRPETFGQLLLLKAFQGVGVTVVMYHEDNITIDQTKHTETDPEMVRDEIRRAFRSWSTLRLNFETARQQAERRGDWSDISLNGSFRIVQLRRRHLPYRVTYTEKRALITLRFYTEMYNSGFCIDAATPSGAVDMYNMPIHTQIRRDLMFLIEQNLAASERRYQEWAAAG